MRRYIGKHLRTLARRDGAVMSNINVEAPVGIVCIQRLSGWFCPRLQVNRLRCYQASILVLTYFTYLTYHLTRKPLSVVKSVLYQNCSELVPPPGVDPTNEYWCDWPPFNTSDANTLLGALDSAFLFSYAGAMFVSGMIAERVDLRYFLSLGMLFSAIFCYLFGIGKTYSIHNMSYYILVQAGAGIAQTTGWPGTVAIIGKWFGNSKKGLIFGLWTSHTSLGNIFGTLMASEYVEKDWALSFIYPALVMGAVGILVFIFLAPEPKSVGLNLPDDREVQSTNSRSRRSIDDDESQVIVGDQAASLRPNRHSTNSAQYQEEERDEATESTALLTSRSSQTSAVSLTRALAIPGVLEFSLSLFFAKLVSYTFLFWLPMYINRSAHLSPRQAGDLSTVFDVGGVAGAALAGLAADCTARPACVCLLFYLLSAPTLFAYQAWGASSYWCNAALLALGGLLVNGPYALITTAVSAELGTHSSLSGNSQALATVTAIIDGTGSVGAAIGPMLAGVVSGNDQWSHVFYMLIICNCMAFILLLRIGSIEMKKWRQERRLASPRVVRIE